MEGQTEVMRHDHVGIAVEGSSTTGVELVPAQHLEGRNWLVLHSPLYALQVVAGDTIRIVNDEAGTFEIIARGGNVAVQFYLSEWDDPQVTTHAARKITPGVVACGGRIEGQTRGLLVFTIPLKVGFSAIENIFFDAVEEFPGAQWQYTNVYDLTSGEPLNWWE